MGEFFIGGGYVPLARRAELDHATGLQTIWPGLPISAEALAYVPRDARQRADMYARTAGMTADYFPIPLTPIQQ